MSAPTLILYGSPDAPVVKRILERLKGVPGCTIDLRSQAIKCPVATFVDPNLKVRLHGCGEEGIIDLVLRRSSSRKLVSNSS